jgi:zeaxanthin glucosyltransferase
MKLGFVCLNLPGHLNPMTALARHLQDRGHEVVFLYSSGAAGLPFVPGLEADYINQNRPQLSKMEGEGALQFSVRVLLDQTEAVLKSLPAVVQANGVDALIIDTVQFYAELGAMQLGIPYIYMCQTRCTSTSLVTRPSVLMDGLTRLPLQLWLKPGRC